MKKVLWLSRHDMTPEQERALGQNVTITKVDGTVPNVHVPFQAVVDNAGEATELPALKTLAQEFDVLAVVLPINVKQQLLGVTDRPVIEAVNKRELIADENGGERKVVFNFVKWQRIVAIDVVVEDWPVNPA